MRRGTTPTISVLVRNSSGESLDLTEQDGYYLTFKEEGHYGSEITKTDPQVEVDGDATRFTVRLTQMETLSFRPGRNVEVQLRSKRDDRALATTIAKVKAERILKEGVI